MTSHSDLWGSRSSRMRRRPGRRWWRAILLTLGGLLLLAVLYTTAMVGVAVMQVSRPLAPDVRPDVRPLPVQTGQRVNILALGINDDNLHTDNLLLISVDPAAKRAAFLQIPPGTRALLAGKGTLAAIDDAYAAGAEDRQFPANLRAMKTVEDLLDISINYTVVVDPEGLQKLDGQQVLEFVGWRHNNDGTGHPDGDLGRIGAQQQFLDLLAWPNQLVGISRHISTTMEASRVLTLAKLAAGMKREDVTFATLPGTDADVFDPQSGARLRYYLMDPVEARKLVDRQIRGIDPAEAAGVRVTIAGEAGAAARLSERLVAQGFPASAVTPGSGTVPDKTRVTDLRGDPAKARLVAQSLVSLGYTVETVSQPDSGAAADVSVVLGQTLPAD